MSSGDADALAVHRAAVDEMVLPKIQSGTISTEKALGNFLMSTAVKGTLKLIAGLQIEKFIVTYRRYLAKYTTALEAKNRFDEAAVAIERRIAQGDPATIRVLEGLMAAHDVGREEAKSLLLSKTRDILRVKVETAAKESQNAQAEAAPAAAAAAAAAFVDAESPEALVFEEATRTPEDASSAASSPTRPKKPNSDDNSATSPASFASNNAKPTSNGGSRRATPEGGSSRRASSSGPAGGGGTSLPAMLRTAVSKKKRRFVDGHFNLDLSYIPLSQKKLKEGDPAATGSDGQPLQIISMGFPCVGSEKLYRNPYDEVLSFFEERHPNNYILFNLCSERKYEPESFTKAGTACGVNMRYRFHDHNPPPLGYFAPFCQDMEDFISSSPEHVCAVHCKAGKGRTGTMIVAYIACKLQVSIPEAMNVFAQNRTYDGKGVTIPSQKRFLYYFGQILKAAFAGASVGVGDNAGRSAGQAPQLENTTVDGGDDNTAAASGTASSNSASSSAGKKAAGGKLKSSAGGGGGSGGGGGGGGGGVAAPPSLKDHFFQSLSHNPLRPFYRSLLPPVQPVLLMSLSFLGVPSVQSGGFTPYFVIENNAWRKVSETDNKVHNTPTWVLTSKQLGLPSNFVKATDPGTDTRGAAGGGADAATQARRRRRSAGSASSSSSSSSSATTTTDKARLTRSLSADQAGGVHPSERTGRAGSFGSDDGSDGGSVEGPAASSTSGGSVQVLTMELPEPVELVNEVRITVYHKNSLRQKVKLFAFWLHTGFLERQTIFSKIELDGAHKDKKHKIYPANFRLQLNIEKLDPHVSAQEMNERQEVQRDCLTRPFTGVKSNSGLVTVKTIEELPGENASTILSTLRTTASQPNVMLDDDESSEEEYDDAESFHASSPAPQPRTGTDAATEASARSTDAASSSSAAEPTQEETGGDGLTSPKDE